MKSIRNFVFSISPFLFTSQVFAAGSDIFEATCTDARVEGYRFDRDLDGKVTSGWAKDEKFGQMWKFKYGGGNKIQIDDKVALVVSHIGPILIAIAPAETEVAATLWTYVIHLDLRQVSAAQVNGYSFLGDGIKARNVQLNCSFKFSK